MKEYLLVFRSGSANQERTQEQMAQSMEGWKNWIGSIAQQGKFIGGQPLNLDGRVLSNGGKNITDAPFAEGKEVVNGYLIINAADYDEAVRLSKDCPIFTFDDNGTVEVREIARMDM